MSNDKTTIRETKYGDITKLVSFYGFPDEIHQGVKEIALLGTTVSEVYSNAISDMRRDHDTGVDIVLIHPPLDGIKIQIWLREDAEKNLRFLSRALRGDHTAIVYNAMLRFFEGSRQRGL